MTQDITHDTLLAQLKGKQLHYCYINYHDKKAACYQYNIIDIVPHATRLGNDWKLMVIMQGAQTIATFRLNDKEMTTLTSGKLQQLYNDTAIALDGQLLDDWAKERLIL